MNRWMVPPPAGEVPEDKLQKHFDPDTINTSVVPSPLRPLKVRSLCPLPYSDFFLSIFLYLTFPCLSTLIILYPKRQNLKALLYIGARSHQSSSKMM